MALHLPKRQLINVAFGDTLYQDIPIQMPSTVPHRDTHAYDQNFYTLEIVPNTRLKTLLANENSYKINVTNHQGIKDLAPGFEVEDRCPDDGMIEAIRHFGAAYVAAVQWHPEFHRPGQGTLDDTPRLADFLEAARTSTVSKKATKSEL